MSIDIKNHMEKHSENHEKLVQFDERFNSYYLIIKSEDGVDVRQQIKFCPWCGESLPESLRGKWFDELEALGIDPMNDEIPERFKSSAWMRG